MNRTIKQLIYGSLYLVILGLLGWGIYGLVKPTASCFDQKLNQDEEEVDCGGASCIVCAILHLKPIEVKPLILFPVGDQMTTLLEFRNANATYGASSFAYTVTLYDAQGTILASRRNTSFIYPTEIKYLFGSGYGVDSQKVAKGVVMIEPETMEWKPLNEFSLPRVIRRSIVVEKDPIKNDAIIRGTLVNDNSFLIPRATIVGIASDAFGLPLGASQTVIQNVAPQEEAAFRIVIPDAGREELLPDDVELYVEVFRN